MDDKWVRHVNREHERLSDEVESMNPSHETILADMTVVLRRYRECGYEEVQQEFRMMAYRAECVIAEIGRLTDLELRGRDWRLNTVKTEWWKVREDFERFKHDNWSCGVGRQYGKDKAHRQQQVKEDDQPRWDAWRAEAERIKSASNEKPSKRNLARMVKRNLSLEDSEETIRKRL